MHDTHTGDELAWRAEMVQLTHELPGQSATTVPAPTITVRRRGWLARTFGPPMVMDILTRMVRNERGEVGLAELVHCVSCGRDLVAGRAQSHAQRFHNGAPVVVVPDSLAWRNAERRLSERRVRVAETLFELRQSDRRVAS